MKLDNLQLIINKKAEDRAVKEVLNFINAMHTNSHILKALDNYYLKINDKNISIRSALFNKRSELSTELIKELTKIYIPIESQNFVNKVKQLEEELELLKDYNYDNRN